jgi:hypothetical protein
MSAALLPPRQVHVLFLHGVGRHSRLSSLLQAYQALRSNLDSVEAPVSFEDPIPNWKLAEFIDSEVLPCLRLEPRVPGAQSQLAASVYLYEINYSALAGTVRENQPLDITQLFVGFDLAVNVARARLRQHPAHNSPGAFCPNNAKLASRVQKLAEVCVASTVPILGAPSWVLSNFTQTYVATFSRFFEDIATFALDKNGEQLILAHIERTIESIVSGPTFSPPDNRHKDDLFVIAAHSLGTIVVHNYLVRNWHKGGRLVPDKLLTFGSPIGLVCWLWLFLDFPRLVFAPERPTGENYFCWLPESGALPAIKVVEWTNVINYMDPVATAFPKNFVDMSRSPGYIQGMLKAGDVKHHFLKRPERGLFSTLTAHTSYFADRYGFVELLAQLTKLLPEDNDLLPKTPPDAHWGNMRRDLLVLQLVCWAAGISLATIYLVVIDGYYGTSTTFGLLPFFICPPLTIRFFAFFQRVIYGGPTKRTSLDLIKELRWRDLSALPHLIRSALRVDHKNPDPLAAAPGLLARLAKGLIAFAPTAAVMLTPVYIARYFSTRQDGPIDLLADHFFICLLMVALFASHVLVFAASEFTRHWRALIAIARSPGPNV